jgi:hypothetical protein
VKTTKSISILSGVWEEDTCWQQQSSNPSAFHKVLEIVNLSKMSGFYPEKDTFDALESKELEAISLSCDTILNTVEGKEQLRQILEEYGVVVVENVCSSEEITQYEQLLGQDLMNVLEEGAKTQSYPKDEMNPIIEKFRNMSKEDVPKEWPASSLRDTLFLNDYKMPQQSFAWTVRLNERVKRVYEALYPITSDTDGNEGDGEKCEQLCVSEDLVFFKPKEYRDPSISLINNFSRSFSAHVDQNQWDPIAGNHRSYQSVLYLWEAKEHDSTTVVWLKSHKEPYQQLMRQDEMPLTHGKMGHHYTEMAAMTNRWLKTNLMRRFVEEARRVFMNAGSLLIFNSRVFHQGWNIGPRLALPICWQPKSLRSSEALARKARIALSGLATTHWATLGHMHDLCLFTQFKRKGKIEKVEYVDENNESREVEEIVFPMDSNGENSSLYVWKTDELRSIADQIKQDCVDSDRALDKSNECLVKLMAYIRPEIADAL